MWYDLQIRLQVGEQDVRDDGLDGSQWLIAFMWTWGQADKDVVYIQEVLETCSFVELYSHICI